jgi:hypothetical protein
MHRTQVLIEEEQYLLLRTEARRSGKSLGQVIRELIDKGLKRESQKKGGDRSSLAGLEGVFDDEGFDVRDHDRVLYGKP